jgi:polysaccharide biosynthesis protein PslH
MKILAITPYPPAPPDFGGAARIYNLLWHLQQRAELTVFSLVGPEDSTVEAAETFERFVSADVPLTARNPASTAKRWMQIRSAVSSHSFQHSFYWHASAQQRLDQILAQTPFDIVQIEFSQMAAYRTPGSAKRVLDLHNIEYDVLRQAADSDSIPKRMFNRLEWQKLLAEEERYWREADLCLATSEPDARRVQATTGRECLVVPNGVDDQYFTREPLSSAKPGAIVFTGAMRYQPNADAAVYFVRRVWPLISDLEPNATFTIVGADPPEEVIRLGERDGVRVTGSVDDVRPWLREASAVVVPLLSGGGTRLKILEAFAIGRPVVATSIGASGLEIEDGKHLLIADRPVDIAQRLVSLLRDPSPAEQLTDNAYQLMHATYRWGTIAENLHDRYRALIADDVRAAGA